MKNKMIYFFSFILLFAGCELFKDANEITISTELTTDIPVVVSSLGKKSIDQTFQINSVAFSQTQDLTLASNEDIEPYLSKIKEINLNSLMVTINGLGTDQIINSISLDVTGVGNIFTQTNITMTNNSFTPVIATGTLDQAATKLSNDKKITLTVSGNASEAMTFIVGLNFDTEIVATVL